jgi:uncharacterized protein (TIGR02118 family)
MTTRARFIVLWGTPQDPVEFDRHYREVHIPLARKMPGLRRYTLSRNEAAIRGGEPYYRVAELDFDDMAAMREAFASPAGQATGADVAVMATSSGASVRSMTYELEDLHEA